MKFVKLAAAVAATTLAFAANAASGPVDLIQNGSFEAQTQGNNSWSSPTTLTYWYADAIEGVTKFELRNGVAGTAQDGANFVELDTNKNSNIFQNLTGTGLYNLSFYYMNRPGTQASTNGLGFSFGGVDSLPMDSANTWTKYSTTLDFGTGSTIKLKFYALGTSDSYGTSLDNISVTAVPEPETYAMMLAGLGLMGFIARRRRAGKA